MKITLSPSQEWRVSFWCENLCQLCEHDMPENSSHGEIGLLSTWFHANSVRRVEAAIGENVVISSLKQPIVAKTMMFPSNHAYLNHICVIHHNKPIWFRNEIRNVLCTAVFMLNVFGLWQWWGTNITTIHYRIYITTADLAIKAIVFIVIWNSWWNISQLFSDHSI